MPGGDPDSRTIGTKVYTGHVTKWQQWDLVTGQPGPVCDMDLDGGTYAGSDGDTVIWYDSGPSSYFATDPATCQTRWEQSAGTGALAAVGKALLRVTRESVTGLRAPE